MRKCLFCQESFKQSHQNRYCHPSCKERHIIKKANDDWVKRKTVNPKSNVFSELNFKKSHLPKNHMNWIRRFDVVRG